MMKLFTAKRTFAAITLGLGFAVMGVTSPCQADPVGVTWRFDSSGNPAQPEVNSGLPEAHAEVTVSGLGLGWTPTFPGLNDASGLYDLGGSGQIKVQLGTAEGVRGPAQLKVQVRQWLDGGIFSEVVAVAVPGAVTEGLALGAASFGPVGGWVVTEDVWTIPAGVTVHQTTITSPVNGAVVDEVSVSLAIAPVAPLVLSIASSGSENGQIEISWPAQAGAGVLEASTNPANSESWEPSGLAAVLAGERYVVTVAAEGSGRFFRVRQ